MRRNREVVLSARVDYNYERRNKGSRLTPSRSSNEGEGVEHEIRRALTADLPVELEEIYGLQVKTRIIAVRSGSIIIFFGAVVSAVGFLSSYSDFFESIALIRKHAGMIVSRVLEDRYGGGYDISIEVEHPRMPEPDYFPPFRRMRKMFGPEFYEFVQASAWAQPELTRHSRDGFFWFLLILSIVLFLLVGALVAGAVWKTYFT